MESCFQVTETQIYLHVKALPGASKSQMLEVKAGRLRVKIAAPPEDGKANAELCAFLAKRFDCPKKAVSLYAGEKSRLKTIVLPLILKEKLENLLKDF
ncbi:MAG: DUF167 domain-containing protein [Treponema sp.]|jgi:uncharacterized protein (TIGR00251 family)|nr:DUF167 domain-containing protein [Treponema sp.]